jgi:hypothetical protein
MDAAQVCQGGVLAPAPMSQSRVVRDSVGIVVKRIERGRISIAVSA